MLCFLEEFHLFLLHYNNALDIGVKKGNFFFFLSMKNMPHFYLALDTTTSLVAVIQSRFTMRPV